MARMKKVVNVLSMSDKEINSAIKIQGTEFDRNRKVTDDMIKTMKYLQKKGCNVSQVARMVGVSRTSVYYNTVPGWAEEFKVKTEKQRNKTHSAVITFSDRAEYKRQLVASGELI